MRTQRLAHEAGRDRFTLSVSGLKARGRLEAGQDRFTLRADECGVEAKAVRDARR